MNSKLALGSMIGLGFLSGCAGKEQAPVTMIPSTPTTDRSPDVSVTT